MWGHASLSRTPAEFDAEIGELNETIPNAARRERREARAFFHGTRLANPNRTIGEETRFDLGGCTAEILLTPGHTPTNLSVWIPEDRVLYTGDCLIHEYLPNLDAGGPAATYRTCTADVCGPIGEGGSRREHGPARIPPSGCSSSTTTRSCDAEWSTP